LFAKIEEIRQQNLPPEKWKPDQLRAMLKWYKEMETVHFQSIIKNSWIFIIRFVAVKIRHCRYLIQMRKWIFHQCNCLIQMWSRRRRILFLHCLSDIAGIFSVLLCE
jgi:hypothetical protein